MATATSLALNPNVFLENMRRLWRCDPALALRVDAVADDERVPVEGTRSGDFTTQVSGPDGRKVHLHSRHDPVAEAKQWAAAVAVGDGFGFVVNGIGLGYHVRALLDRLHTEAFVICTEPSLALLSTALSCVNLSEFLESRRLILLTDAEKSRLHARLQPFGSVMMLGTRFVPHAPSLRLAESAHNEINRAIMEYVTFTRMSLMTLVGNSQITCRNIAMNFVTTVTTPSLEILRDRFSGNPAIIVSAGPSLSRNIDQLAALKGRAVLCAVQTAVRPLMERGILPDFITSLDFHEMSRRFFEGVGDLSESHLVAEPKATWHVVDHFPGPVTILDNAWARLVLGDELAGRDGLPAGATVAHLAFYLAVYVGCDPIIFVGQDLAFTGHVFYLPGVEIHRSWRGEINRFNSMEQKEWERIARNRPILRRVTGVDGREIYTDELLFTYLEQFEKDVAGVPCKVINATEGGAEIRGTIPMTLKDAAERFCRDPLDASRFAYRKNTTWRDRSKLPAAKLELENRLSELEGVETMCDELLVLLRELDDLTEDPARFNQRLIRVDELRTRIHRESRAYQIVNAATQLSELKRFSADRKIEASGVKEGEKAKRQLARDMEFISGVRDGALIVKPMLQEALNRILQALDSA